MKNPGQPETVSFTPQEGEQLLDLAGRRAKVFYHIYQHELPSLTLEDYLDGAFEVFDRYQGYKNETEDDGSLQEMKKDFLTYASQNIDEILKEFVQRELSALEVFSIADDIHAIAERTIGFYSRNQLPYIPQHSDKVRQEEERVLDTAINRAKAQMSQLRDRRKKISPEVQNRPASFVEYFLEGDDVVTIVQKLGLKEATVVKLQDEFFANVKRNVTLRLRPEIGKCIQTMAGYDWDTFAHKLNEFLPVAVSSFQARIVYYIHTFLRSFRREYSKYSEVPIPTAREITAYVNRDLIDRKRVDKKIVHRTSDGLVYKPPATVDDIAYLLELCC